MGVRLATQADALALAELGEDVIVGRDYERFDFEALPSELEQHLKNERMACFVVDGENEIASACMGFVSRGFWNRNEPVANVVLWWSRNPISGRRVLRTFGEFVASVGAKRIISGARDERTERLYTRMGWSPIETNFVKELDGDGR